MNYMLKKVPLKKFNSLNGICIVLLHKLKFLNPIYNYLIQNFIFPIFLSILLH